MTPIAVLWLEHSAQMMPMVQPRLCWLMARDSPGQKTATWHLPGSDIKESESEK
jgi:hypothetical protein